MKRIFEAIDARPVRACVALFALAVVTRLLFLFAFVDRVFPFSVFYYGDSRLYREFALAILRGEVFDNGIPFHPPAFAYVLSAVIAQVGERPTAMRAVLAVIASSSVPLCFLLGRALFASRAAWGGALLATFSFALLVLAVSPNADTIYVPILVLQALLAVRMGDAWDNGKVGRALALAAGSGLVFGLGSLTRAEHLAFALIVPLALAARLPRVTLAAVLKSLVLILGVGALVIAPWTIRNVGALSRFNDAHPALPQPLPTLVLISNYGALNFAMANQADADGTFRPEDAVGKSNSGSLDLTDPEQLDLYLGGYGRGLAFIRDHPGDAAALALRKIRLASGALALGFGATDVPSGLAGVRRPVDLFVPDRRFWMIALLAATIWGCYAERRVTRRAAIVWLLLLHKLVTIVAFFGYARLLGHVLPFLFLFAAAGICALVQGRNGRRVLTFAVAAASLVMVVQLVLASLSPRSLIATGSADPASGKLVQDAEVRLEPSAK